MHPSLLDRFFCDADKKAAISWGLFDFANSSYALLIMTFVFPVYYKEVIAGNARGDLYWALCISLSILVGTIVAPVVGAIADYDGRRKQKFRAATLLAVIGTASLFFVGPNLLLARLRGAFALLRHLLHPLYTHPGIEEDHTSSPCGELRTRCPRIAEIGKT
jgi:MFS-type transporter involved in bile tolerance (Atg22 family)